MLCRWFEPVSVTSNGGLPLPHTREKMFLWAGSKGPQGGSERRYCELSGDCNFCCTKSFPDIQYIGIVLYYIMYYKTAIEKCHIISADNAGK